MSTDNAHEHSHHRPHQVVPHFPQAPDSAWAIQYADQDGRSHTTWMDGLNGPIPTHTAGESGDFPFVLVEDTTEHSPWQTDWSGEETADRLDRYETLRRLGRHAGAYTIMTTPNNRVRYTETSPASAPSLLVALAPTYDTSVPGVWGLVDEVTDDTTLPEAVCQIDLSVTILAPLDAFESRDELTDELEYSGLGI